MIYSGKKINETALESAKWILNNKVTSQNIPTLMVFTNPNNRGCVSYINALRKDFASVGVRLFECPIDEHTTLDQIVNTYASASGVNAVMIQLPLANRELIYDWIFWRLAAVGASIIDMPYGQMPNTDGPKDYFTFPCTARAILIMIKEYFREAGRDTIEGVRVTIVNRSRNIGRPLAHLLLNENAGVTIYHSKIDMDEIMQHATNYCYTDVFVTATGVAGLIDPSDTYICPFIIDIGTGVDKDGKLCGDISPRFQLYLESLVNEYICPSKSGIGPITRAVVIADTLRLFFEQNEPEEGLDAICEWTMNLNRPFYVP